MDYEGFYPLGEAAGARNYLPLCDVEIKNA
jgi:hypothetical protein